MDLATYDRYFEGFKETKGYRGVLRITEDYADGTAFDVYARDGRHVVSHSEYFGLLDETVRRMDALFASDPLRAAFERAARGREPDDPGRRGWVGLKLSNGPTFALCFWATLASGHPVALIDQRISDAQANVLARDIGAAALITEEMPSFETPYPVILARDVVPDWRDATVRARYERRDNAVANRLSSRDGWAGHICLATSGTTGASRCFVHDDLGMTTLWGGCRRMIAPNDRFGRDGVEEKNLAFIPWHHVFGFCASFLLAHLVGATIVVPSHMSPEAVLQASRDSGVTQLVAVPALWNALAQRAKRGFMDATGETAEAFDDLINLALSYRQAGVDLPAHVEETLGALRARLFGDDLYLGISGGGYILPETLRTMNGLGYFLINGFGMTEISILSVANSDDLEDRLDGSVGRSFYDDAVRRIPVEGADAGDDRGELAVRMNAVYAGSLRDGVYTPNDRSQWFKTGDLCRIQDGKIYLDGRVKDIILRADGENLYPDELEAAFMAVPGFSRYMIFGLSDGLYDEVALLVEPVPGADPETLAGAVADVNKTLPIRERIQRFFITKKPLEISASGKVRRGPIAEALMRGEWPVTEVALTGEIVSTQAVETVSDIELETAGYFKPEFVADPAFFEVRKTIQGIIANVLNIPVEDVEPTAYFSQDLQGDSLQSISILTHAEEQYELSIDERLFNRDLTVNDISALVYRRIRGEFAEPSAMPDADGTRPAVRRIATFEETPEYKAFEKRLEGLSGALSEYGNPYFVAQDSSLRDVSYRGGEEMINFASYNYVGMSGDPEVNEAAIEAIRQYGTSASGSRLLAGEKTVHQTLERALADWKGTEDAVVLVGGHSTNVTFVGNFCGERDLILYDALIHNSVAEGVRLANADARPFPHNDYETLEQILRSRRDRYEKVLIVIEGAYSMDGDVAPVPEFVRIKKKYDAFLMVDEAHSMLVLGEHGRGVDEYFGLDPNDIDVHMGTLSKGFGTCGGYLAGRHSLIEYLRYNLPGFVFSVGISPPLAAAVVKAIEIMRRDNSRIVRLHDNIQTFIDTAHGYGMDTCLAGETAVTPIMIGSDELAFKLSKQLEQHHILVPPAVFPAVARGQARLRFCLTSEHTKAQITYALATLNDLLKPYPEVLHRT